MASNLRAMASNLRAMASNLRAMASNLRAMASNLYNSLVCRSFFDESNMLHPTSADQVKPPMGTPRFEGVGAEACSPACLFSGEHVEWFEHVGSN